MKSKKLLFMIVSTCLLIAMCFSLAACNNEEDPTEQPSESASAEVTEGSESSTKKPYTKAPTNPVSPYKDFDVLSDGYTYKLANGTNNSEKAVEMLNKYMYPIWKTDISYAESAFVRENKNGEVDPLQLLYPIEEVISVRSANLKKVYKEGKDYEVTEDGKLKILEGGSIPVLAYDKYYYSLDGSDRSKFPVSAAGSQPHFAAGVPGKVYVYGEISTAGGGMSQWQLAITYKHSEDDKCVIDIPEAKSDYFVRFINKLKNGEAVKVVSIGDSITEGWSSTGIKGNKAPYCPSYNYLFTDYIQSLYPDAKVTFVNQGVSGTQANQANVDAVIAQNPDLVLIAYGMNDGGNPPDVYISRLTSIIERIDASLPNAAMVVVGTTLPNEKLSWSRGGSSICGYHKQYGPALENAEVTWQGKAYQVAVANMTNVNIQMFNRKVYEDVTGSNTNHPNDYMHRVYAQVIFQTIFGDIGPSAE